MVWRTAYHSLGDLVHSHNSELNGMSLLHLPSGLLMIRIFLFVLFLAVPVSVVAEELKLGLAEFAMLSPHWPCEVVREKEKGLSTLRKAVLWNTFGKETTCLKKDLDDPRTKLLELHLINEPCARNKQCGSYEFLNGISPKEYDDKLKNRDRELVKKLEEYFQEPAQFIAQNLKESTACYVSIGLESNVSSDAALVMKGLLEKHFPRCKVVWNPVNESRWARPIDGTVFELHGAEASIPSPCIANLDGEDISFPDRPSAMGKSIKSGDLNTYFEKHKSCDVTFLWIAEMNGRGGDGPFIDPRDRKTFLTPKLLDDLIEVLQ